MTERERFEAYFKTRKDFVTLGSMFGDPFHKNEIGAYELPQTRQSWETWQAAKAQVVPDGYVVVPIEPTQVMLDKFPEVVYQDTYAGECSVWVDDDTIRLGYKAIIKAAQENDE